MQRGLYLSLGVRVFALLRSEMTTRWEMGLTYGLVLRGHFKSTR